MRCAALQHGAACNELYAMGWTAESTSMKIHANQGELNVIVRIKVRTFRPKFFFFEVVDETDLYNLANPSRYILTFKIPIFKSVTHIYVKTNY